MLRIIELDKDSDLIFKASVFKNDLSGELISLFNIFFEKFLKDATPQIISSEHNSKTFLTTPIDVFKVDIDKRAYGLKKDKTELVLMKYLIASMVELDNINSIKRKSNGNIKAVLAAEQKAFSRYFDESDQVSFLWRQVNDGYVNVEIVLEKYRQEKLLTAKRGEEKKIKLKLKNDLIEEKKMTFKKIKRIISLRALEKGLVLSPAEIEKIALRKMDQYYTFAKSGEAA